MTSDKIGLSRLTQRLGLTGSARMTFLSSTLFKGWIQRQVSILGNVCNLRGTSQGLEPTGSLEPPCGIATHTSLHFYSCGISELWHPVDNMSKPKVEGYSQIDTSDRLSIDESPGCPKESTSRSVVSRPCFAIIFPICAFLFGILLSSLLLLSSTVDSTIFSSADVPQEKIWCE
jgi:hypothetical protein